MPNVEQIAEELDKLTLLEAAQLSKMLQEKWGVSAAAPVAVAAMPGGGGAAGFGSGFVMNRSSPKIAMTTTRPSSPMRAGLSSGRWLSTAVPSMLWILLMSASSRRCRVVATLARAW